MNNAEKKLVVNNTMNVVNTCTKLIEDYQTRYRVKSQMLMEGDSEEYQEHLERAYENTAIDAANKVLVDEALKAVKGLKKVLRML
jgi:hypothetical protein